MFMIIRRGHLVFCYEFLRSDAFSAALLSCEISFMLIFPIPVDPPLFQFFG